MTRRVTIYQKELDSLKRSKKFLENEGSSHEELREEFSTLIANYEELLDQTKIITRISDRLQGKLNLTNEKLNDKNEELQRTIDDLLKARMGKKATYIVLIFAIALFILTEAFVEPQIENYASAHFARNAMMISLLFKGFIALLIKPIESLTERALIKRARKRQMDGKNPRNKSTLKTA